MYHTTTTGIDVVLGVSLFWNPVTQLQEMLSYHFMVNAFTAGSIVAVVAGATGYFMVLRRQSFAGHTLANVGFAGAAGAPLAGVSPIVGLLVVCIGAAVGIGLLDEQQGRFARAHAVAVGTVHTFALGLGLLFIQLSSTYVENVYALLFGSVLGVSDDDVRVVAVTALLVTVALILIGRRLLFASIDPDVAQARGVQVRLLSIVFLVLLAFAVAEAVQIVGILLVFALLVTPAAIAEELTARPWVAVALAIGLALIFTWAGIWIAYFTPYPIGFCVTSLAFAVYLLVRAVRSGRRWFLQSWWPRLSKVFA